jgi:site-specific DNA recombinase
MTSLAPSGRASEYRRVSMDKSNREKSNEEQGTENNAAAGENNLSIDRVYSDIGSASRFSRKSREGFDRLMADLDAGVFHQGDTLIMWESSRGSRRESEWHLLLDALQDNDVLVHITTHHRTYDLHNHRDRRTLSEDGTDSAYESGKLSNRLLRAREADALAGLPHGRAPYGYTRRYDATTRKLIAQEPQPIEAEIVRELYDRLRRGHTLNSIAVDLEKRGVRSRSGTVSPDVSFDRSPSPRPTLDYAATMARPFPAPGRASSHPGSGTQWCAS